MTRKVLLSEREVMERLAESLQESFEETGEQVVSLHWRTEKPFWKDKSRFFVVVEVDE